MAIALDRVWWLRETAMTDQPDIHNALVELSKLDVEPAKETPKL